MGYKNIKSERNLQLQNNWTVKNILKGKTILFIIITLILTKVFYETANKALNLYLNQFNNHSIYTHNYSFDKYGLILIIPAAIITILILQHYVKMTYIQYIKENDIIPNEMRELATKHRTILTHKVTKSVLIIIGMIFSIFFIIEFT